MKTIVLSGTKDYDLRFHDENVLLRYENFAGRVNLELSGKVSLYEVSSESSIAKRYLSVTGNVELSSVLHNGNYDLEIILSDQAACSTRSAFLADNADTSFNYFVKHRGRSSKSDLYLYSLVKDASKTSTLEINFEPGAVDSEAQEKETAMLLNDSAKNRSTPAIYCGEENIRGSHALSCGHISADKLTYLKTRGLNDNQIQKLLIESNIQYITSRIKSKTVLKYIQEIVKKYV